MSKPVVFIPALLCDESLYTEIITGLGSDVDAQVMLSPKPVLNDSVADILARAPAKFALMGTSYGASLALEIALAAPERVTALCLSGNDAGAPDTAMLLGMAQMIETDFEATLSMLSPMMVHEDAVAAKAAVIEMARRVGPAAGAAQARALAKRADAFGRLSTLHMPVLLLWGKEDAVAPVAAAREMAAAFPHAHFYAIPGSGHFPTLEKPEAVIPILRDWLEDDHVHHH